MKREFLQSLRVGESALPKEIVDAIMAENGRDIQAHRQAAQQWEDKYQQAMTDHAAQLADLRFEGLLKEAVTASRGRNLKAIAALLDIPALKESPEPETAIGEALQQVRKENAYLFDTEPTPPPYAEGTGTQTAFGQQHPETLAGALRERFENR